jgi:hypothetical protein
MYESAFHLGMEISCTNGTPTLDTLGHLPPLPLFISYWPISEQDEFGLYQALRLQDRIRHIYLNLSPSVIHKCLKLIDGCFPILENLSLVFVVGQVTNHTLPKALLAPNLRHLDLNGIGLSKRLRLLTSSVSLVTLKLQGIPTSSFFRPRLLVARLSSLLQLEELWIGFSISRPSDEGEQLGEQGTPVTLPNLKSLIFEGVGSYLDCLVAQIRTPLLERLDVTLFKQIVFALPHLWHLINSKEVVQPPTAMVSFGADAITFTSHQRLQRDGTYFSLSIKGEPFDWQINCAAQISSALLPILSGLEKLNLDFYRFATPTAWENGEIDSTMWHELLRSFMGVKELVIKSDILEKLSCALGLDEVVGSDPEFLPNLQVIVAETNHFSSFIDTRRVVDRPVRFSPPLLPPGRNR